MFLPLLGLAIVSWALVDVRELVAEAEAALSRGDLDRAQRVAEQVIEQRYLYGFELLARVHAARENLPRAIAVLQEGVGKAPRAWQLWALLAVYRSDHGDYDGALAACDAALAIDGADSDEIHITAAVAHDRAGRPEDALMRLHEVLGTSESSTVTAARVRADILNETERPDAAAAAAKAGLASVTDDSVAPEVALLHASLARAELLRGNREAALQSAWDALAFDATEETALRLVRELEAEFSPSAQLFRLIVRGIDPASEAEGFWRKYEVVADDEEQALTYAARVEPEHIRPSLRVEESEVVEPAPDQPKGVCWCTEYAFFDDDLESGE